MGSFSQTYIPLRNNGLCRKVATYRGMTEVCMLRKFLPAPQSASVYVCLFNLYLISVFNLLFKNKVGLSNHQFV
jgi:hypothetical protein